MRKFILASVLLIVALTSTAQTQIQNSGWLTFSNSTKLNQKIGFGLDLQLRSSDNWDGVRNILVRPSITYYLSQKSNLTVGYLYAYTHDKLFGGDNNLLEHRVWEQFVFTHPLKSSFVTHRARLEQRFIETLADDIFAQRFRYLIRVMQPLQGYKESFDQGLFFAVQNELFFNIQNKELLNGSLFDQNRLYIGVGYRVSKKLDIEAGYLNQYSHGQLRNTSNRIAQLAISTRF